MMTEDQQNNQIDKVFRDGLQFHKDQPSKDIWARIKTDLDKDDRLIYLKRKRRNLLIISGLLLILMGLGLIYIRSTDVHSHYAKEESANHLLKNRPTHRPEYRS